MCARVQLIIRLSKTSCKPLWKKKFQARRWFFSFREFAALIYRMLFSLIFTTEAFFVKHFI